MDLIPILIGFPAVMAVILPFLKNERVRGIVVYIGAGCVIALALANLGMWLAGGGVTVNLYMDTELIDHAMTVVDLFLMCLIIYMGIKYRKILVIILTVVQTGLLMYVEFTAQLPENYHMMEDGLAILMCIIVAIVGSLICIYAVGYMKGYHKPPQRI